MEGQSLPRLGWILLDTRSKTREVVRAKSEFFYKVIESLLPYLCFVPI